MSKKKAYTFNWLQAFSIVDCVSVFKTCCVHLIATMQIGLFFFNDGTPNGNHHGDSMGTPWEPHGQTHGDPMGTPWTPHGEAHGKTMGNPWENHGNPWETHGQPIGNPWEPM